MEQGAAATVPPGWQLATEVDSRLEADLAARLLAARDITAVVVASGTGDFAVYVAAGDRDDAEQALDVS